ncbi:MAG: right-handed parallel beta-helix repeat-containing protein [bacterium]
MKTSPRQSGYLTLSRVVPLLVILIGLSHAHGAIDWRTYTPPVTPIEIKEDSLAKQFYVAPDGDDALDGLAPVKSGSSGPFATISRARNEIRKLRQSGILKDGIAVNLRGGVYQLPESLVLTKEDSGSESSPVVYRAFKDENPRLAGGKMLKASDFAPVTDSEMSKRLAPEAQGKVLVADLKALGLKHTGPFPDIFKDGGAIFELFFNGKRMKLSRWPYDDYTTMKEVTVIGDKTTPGTFVYREEEPARWNPTNGVWLKGQWRVGWEDPAIKVGSISSTNHQITFATPYGPGIGSKYKRTTAPFGSGQEKWCAINLPEEIRQPGQWAIDFNSQKLYFWPPAPLEGADIVVSQLDQPLVSVDGAANLAFIGLTFEGSLGEGMVITNGVRDLVAGCTLLNLGGNGIQLQGRNCGIQSCDMHDLGKGCILVNGNPGDRKTLTPSGNYIVNNHLHHYGVLKAQYSAAINTARIVDNVTRAEGVVGCYVAHNLIHHAPRDAFLYGGNDCVYEFNEVHRCAYDTADTGAFYSWMDWTLRGVVIRYNFIHDTVGGYNPDDGAGGSLVFGNIFMGDRSGVHIASGPDNSIINNVFIKEEGPVFGIDDRGLSRGYATNSRLVGSVQEINPTQPPWSDRYPEIVNLLQERHELPLRTLFKDNVIYIKSGEPYKLGLKSENKTNPAIIKFVDNLVTNSDPGFVDLAAGNFALKKDSEVFTKIPGFQPIPFDKMGLYLDKYRKKLPTPSEAGRLPEQNPWKPADTDKHFST